MNFPDRKIVERLRSQYSKGSRVVLDRMEDFQAPPIGTKGTVPIEYVNPNGKIYSGYLDSNFDPTQLENIALAAGGRYYSVESLSAMNMALSSIIKKQDVIQSYYIKTVDDFYYDKMIIVSLCCFALAWVIKRLYLKEFI